MIALIAIVSIACVILVHQYVHDVFRVPSVRSPQSRLAADLKESRKRFVRTIGDAR